MLATIPISAFGWYIEPIDNMPFDRLVTNCNTYINAHPNDHRGYYVLARLYANEWATENNVYGVWKTEFGQEPPEFKAPGSSLDRAARIEEPGGRKNNAYFRLALENYERAIAHFDSATNRNDNRTERLYLLGYAWLHEEGANGMPERGLPPFEDQSDVLTTKDKEEIRTALDEYTGDVNSSQAQRLFANRDAALTVASTMGMAEDAATGPSRFVKQAWIRTAVDLNKRVLELSPKTIEPQIRSEETGEIIAVRGGGFDEFVSEACQAIILLADMDDALQPELATAKEAASARKEVNDRSGRRVTPIVLSLSPDRAFADLLSPTTTARFDLDGDGLTERWPWVAKDTALLVWIGDGTNVVDSGRDLIGSRTWWVFWKDGYEPLQFLDDDGDGWLRGGELDGLGLWFDRDGDAVADVGEVRPVRMHDIAGVNTQSTGRDRGTLISAQGIELTDGTVLPTWDWEPMEIGK